MILNLRALPRAAELAGLSTINELGSKPRRSSGSRGRRVGEPQRLGRRGALPFSHEGFDIDESFADLSSRAPQLFCRNIQAVGPVIYIVVIGAMHVLLRRIDGAKRMMEHGFCGACIFAAAIARLNLRTGSGTAHALRR